MQLLVLGMHRSGTSLVTNIMESFGCYVGEEFDLYSVREDNIKGFWERKDVVDLNNEILLELGCEWNKIFSFNLDGLNDIEKAKLPMFRNEINNIIKKLDDRKPWVIKDPRLSLLFNFWKNELNDPICILTHRNPIDIASSLRKRDNIPVPMGIALWMKYSFVLNKSIKNEKKIDIFYESILSEPIAIIKKFYNDLIQSGVRGIKWPGEEAIAAIVENKLCHHSVTKERVKYYVTEHQSKYIESFAIENYENVLTSYENDLLVDLEDNINTQYAYSKEISKNINIEKENIELKKALNKYKDGYEIYNEKYIKLSKLYRKTLLKQNYIHSHFIQKLFIILKNIHTKILICIYKFGFHLKKLGVYKARKIIKAVDYIVIKNSGIFDSEYYLEENPDVAEAKIDPLYHFIACGIENMWNPNAFFNVIDYIKQNPDVSNSILNPVVHYILFGLKEGRLENGLTISSASNYSFSSNSKKKIYETNLQDELHDCYETQNNKLKLSKNIFQNESTIKFIAFYLPQFHPIPENDEWWGKGFTEWTNVTKSKPFYPSHYQPKLPGELGFYDLRIPEIQERQVELAIEHGIYGFCFHFYWFSGKRLLDLPVEQFIANSNIDFPFCFCWANENWTRRWDGQEADVLLEQKYDDKEYSDLIKDLTPYFANNNYIKIDGRPLILIYRPDVIKNINRLIKFWREHCKQSGLNAPFIVGAETFGLKNPTKMGFDAGVEFPPHNLGYCSFLNSKLNIYDSKFNGYIFDIEDHINNPKNQKYAGYNLFKTVFPSWDNTARRKHKASIFENTTPDNYKRWLSSAVKYTKNYLPPNNQFVFINAWNEWAEGAYLEPDRKYGFAYLNKTTEVLKISFESKESIPRIYDNKYHQTSKNNNSLKYHFLHIPKTAGMSLYTSIEKAIGKSSCQFYHTHQMRESRKEIFEKTIDKIKISGGHLQFNIVKNMIKNRHYSWKFFTIVRDPKDRLESLYNYLINSDHPDHYYYKNMNLDNFLLHIKEKNISMCKMFDNSGKFKAANDAILNYKVSVYTLDQYENLLKDLSLNLGVKIKQSYQNKFKKKKISIPNDDLIMKILSEDYKLYDEAKNGSYAFNLNQAVYF